MGSNRRSSCVAAFLGLLLSLGAATANAAGPRPGGLGGLHRDDFQPGPPSSDLLSLSVGFDAADVSLGGTWRVALVIFASPPAGAPWEPNLGSASLTLDDWQCTGQETPQDSSDDTFVDVLLLARPRFAATPTGHVSPRLQGARLSGTLTASYAAITNPCLTGAAPPHGTLEIPFHLRLGGVGKVEGGCGDTACAFQRDAKGFIWIRGTDTIRRTGQAITGSLQRQLRWPNMP